MNCTEFNHYLDEGIDQGLGEPAVADAEKSEAFQAHLGSCEACKAVYTAEMRIIESLRAMPVPVPTADFEDRVLANAFKANAQTHSTQQKHHHRQGFMVGFGTAAAAALAVWIGVGLPTQEEATVAKAPDQLVASTDRAQQKAEPAVKQTEVVTQVAQAPAEPKPIAKQPVKQPVLSIALHTQKKVKLAFASSQALTGAKITIRLPDNVALVGYPGRRQLSWETNLKKGDNLLSLPVVATQVASGELIADIEYKGQVKTLRVNLLTNAAGATSRTNEVTPVIG